MMGFTGHGSAAMAPAAATHAPAMKPARANVRKILSVVFRIEVLFFPGVE
ncbi:MAG: hypothetical protein IPM02_01990 [Betaproteobacteria bacterium]|nr:hypothetical protein [Betaproteobacteria bacterium]